MQEEFFPKIDKRDLVRLGKYQVFLKLMIEGAGTLGPEKEWEEYILKMS